MGVKWKSAKYGVALAGALLLAVVVEAAPLRPVQTPGPAKAGSGKRTAGASSGESAGAPQADCPACRGLGIVPLKPLRPYVHVEGSPAPKPQNTIRCRYCPKCQPDRDPQTLVQAEAERLKTAGRKHLEWERKTGWNLVRVETHHVTIHAQLPPAEARRAAMAVEMMTAHLQQLTKSMELTPTRPDNCEIIILWEKANYLRFLKLMEPQWAAEAGKLWAMLPQMGGWTSGQTSFFYQVAGSDQPPAHMAVHLAASRQLLAATGHRAPTWLYEGFAAYCEYAVLRKNLVHSVHYSSGDVRIGPNWPWEIRRFAAAGRLRPWKDLLARDLADYQAVDYLSAYAIVAFLINTDPAGFLDFVRNVREGLDGRTALEKAYGKSVEQLQARWLRWLSGRR